jgi:hypothetical protein
VALQHITWMMYASFCRENSQEIGQDGGGGGLIAWPFWSPDLTPLDFLCGLLCRITCYQSQMQATLSELWQITCIMKLVDNTLRKVWKELDY